MNTVKSISNRISGEQGGADITMIKLRRMGMLVDAHKIDAGSQPNNLTEFI